MFTRVRIVGPSMEPALRNGDWWLVRRGGRVRPGDVIAFRHPHRPEALLVKRVSHAEADGWWVLGDRVDASEDSRRFGAVPHDALVGRLLWCYRRGRGTGGGVT